MKKEIKIEIKQKQIIMFAKILALTLEENKHYTKKEKEAKDIAKEYFKNADDKFLNYIGFLFNDINNFMCDFEVFETKVLKKYIKNLNKEQ